MSGLSLRLIKICSVLFLTVTVEVHPSKTPVWTWLHESVKVHTNSLHAGLFFKLLLSSADSFQNKFYHRIFQEHHQCQMVWIKGLPGEDRSHPLASKVKLHSL